MKKILILLIVFNLISMPVLALELDNSFDDEVRRNYNPSKLELETLPDLPKTQAKPVTPKPSTNTPPKTLPGYDSTVNQTLPKSDVLTGKAQIDKEAIKIPKGTKFKVISNEYINDYMGKGRKINFLSTKPVTKRYVTVPTSTRFTIVVLDSHPPQRTGNGGLVVMKAEKMYFNGKAYDVNASMTKANSKKVFLNNIKGERGYLKGVVDSTRFGRGFYSNMYDLTSRLADGPITMILSPFTVIAGVLVLGVNIVGSPVLGLFARGGRLTIPAGSEFEIKFLDDLYL